MSEETTKTAPPAAAQEERTNAQEFEFEQNLGRAEAVAYLEAILDGLRKGRLTLSRGSEHMELKPGNLLSLEVEASQKGDSEKLEFELKWQVVPAAARLRITAGE